MKRFDGLKTGLLAAVTVLAMASVASADVIGPDEQACQGSAAGAACVTATGGAGTCTTRTVSQGNPAWDVTRVAVVCVANGNVDGSIGSDPGPAPSRGCSVNGQVRHGAGAGAALALLGLATIVSRRRARR
ncbi:MAG: hypothetical protein WCJ30_25465 [Deltaproteobacteria bacterium]